MLALSFAWSYYKVTLDAGPSKLIFYEIRVKESWEVSVQLRPMSFERTL